MPQTASSSPMTAIFLDCPRCGHPLTPNPSTTGPGDALRCSRYPRCRYVQGTPIDVELRAAGAPELPGLDKEEPMPRPGAPLIEVLGGRSEDRLPAGAEGHGPNAVYQIPLDEIRKFSRQARGEPSFTEEELQPLAGSMRRHGVLQAVTLRYSPAADGTKYELIAGERRLRAARMAGLTTIPATIPDLDDGVAMEVHLLENMLRKDLNPIETARAYQSYLDETGATQAALGKVVGKTQAAISNTLRLLQLPEEIQGKIISSEMTEYNGRLLLGLKPEAADVTVNLPLSGGWTYVKGKDLPGLAPQMSGQDLQKAISVLNGEVATKAREDRQQQEMLQSLQAKAAETGMEVKVAPTRHEHPEGCDSIPRLWVQSTGQYLDHEKCSSCDRRAAVFYPNGSAPVECTDPECREAVSTELKRRKNGAEEARKEGIESNRKKVLDALEGPALRRLALYALRTAGSYDEEARTERFAELPADLDAMEIAREVARKVVLEIVKPYGGDYGTPHRLARGWVAEHCGVDREWLLGASGLSRCKRCGEVGEGWDRKDLCPVCEAAGGSAGTKPATEASPEACEVCIPANCDHPCDFVTPREDSEEDQHE